MLPVDFQDDILAESMNGRRKYQMITNSDGTVSFVDVTEYTQVGSNFGQAQVNATNEAVNESADKNKIIDDKDDLVANSQAGMIAGALAVKAIREELNQNMPVAGNYPVINDDGGIVELPYTADAPCRVMITGVSTSEDYQTYNVLINDQYVATRQFSNHTSLTFRDSFYLRTGDTINASGQCALSAQLFSAN